MVKTIRKYDSNRKLYDMENGYHVSSKQIADLIKAGETIVVVGYPSGKDETAATLHRYIAENEVKNSFSSSSELLHGILRTESGTVTEYFNTLKNGGAK